METLFNDGNTAKAMLSKLKIYNENAMLDDIRNQAESDPHFHWGGGSNVLIISDSALGRALGLLIYLSVIADFKSVRFCQDIDQIEEYLNSTTPDIIIFVGMPDNIKNYHAIHMAQKVNKHVMVAMCDFLDDIIESECRLFGIRYAFSSYKPIKDGLLYLRQAFDDNKKYYRQID